MSILGFRSEVLLHQLPWYCLSCFTCLDTCPQGGDVGEVMFAIRNLATIGINVREIPDRLATFNRYVGAHNKLRPRKR